MSRMYLAAHVLIVLHYYTKPSSLFGTHRPKDASLTPAWLKTQGACVCLACQKFADVWDPRTPLNEAHQDQAHHNTPARRTTWNRSQHKRNSSSSDKLKAHGDSKTVLFYFERGDMFELDSSITPRMYSHGASISDALLRCLGRLEFSHATSITLHPKGNLALSDSVQTLAALWEMIGSQELPVFRVQDFAASPDVAANARSSQPTIQQMYANHRILTLEILIDELPDSDAQIARPLFELIRKGHSRSREHVQDLEAIFAPAKQRNADKWERSSQMKKLLDEVARGKSQLLKLEDLVDHLDDDHAEDARAMLHVIRRTLKGGKGFGGELSKLFQPVKQRNAEAWERVSRMKKIFGELEQLSQLPGENIAHASQSDSRDKIADGTCKPDAGNRTH